LSSKFGIIGEFGVGDLDVFALGVNAGF